MVFSGLYASLLSRKIIAIFPQIGRNSRGWAVTSEVFKMPYSFEIPVVHFFSTPSLQCPVDKNCDTFIVL